MKPDRRPVVSPKAFQNMSPSNPISEDLIAACGMNCAVCSRYLAHVHKFRKSRCIGCRPRNKRCNYLFEKCSGINHGADGDGSFCFECGQYPCKQINRIDARYRKNYAMSMKDNLEFIRTKGLGPFVKEQYGKYRCPKCAGVRSVHNGKCFACDVVTGLIDKNGASTPGQSGNRIP